MSNPDQIRADIERTRANLDLDVDALADKVSPQQIAERQKEKVRSRVTDVRESIMGGVHHAQDRVGDAAGSARDSGSDGASGAVSAAKGHPIVVGAIAFGVGWLLSSLLPATDGEQQLASRAKAAGQEIAGDLKQPAQEAAQHLKGTAQDAAQTVKDEGASAAQDVKGQAQDSRDTVQGQASDAKDRLQGQAQDARQNLRS